MIGYIVAGVAFALVLSGRGILRNVLVRLLWCIRSPFCPGDTISIGKHGGVVEVIGWQAVQLRGPSGELISVPNATVLSQPVVQSVSESGSQGIEMFFPVPNEIEPQKARWAAQRAVVLSPYLALDRPISVALEKGEQESVRVRIQAGVFDSRLRAHFETSVIEVYQTCLEGSREV